MPEIVPASARPIPDAERRVFSQLGLTPGNWAALVAVPFHQRSGIRPPNLQQRSDALHLETLRRELRTASGLSEETSRFWLWLNANSESELVEFSNRLLAWYLASDLSFRKRELVLNLFAQAARSEE